jgi:hypothetical protein
MFCSLANNLIAALEHPSMQLEIFEVIFKGNVDIANKIKTIYEQSPPEGGLRRRL